MTACLVFNHHSLPFDTVEAANQALPDFFKICIQSKNVGLSPVLVDETIDKSWFRLALTNHYFWQDWYNQNKDGDNRERIQAFRSIATQSPLFSTSDMDAGADLFEVSFHGTSDYSAIRAAAWHDAPLASFPTRELWIRSPLDVKVETLDITGEIITTPKGLLNFYDLSIFEKELPHLIEQQNARVRSGKEIYEKRDELYPNITFCGKAQQQLNSWSAQTAILTQVKESLTILNGFSEKWRNGEFFHYSAEALIESGLNHQVSGESTSVMDNSRLRSEREFWLPEGRKVVFEDHIKLSHGYRIHFYPDTRSKHIYVGYIGPHLRLR